jgi:thiol-disulfide isomerase/thioredoxin
MNPLKRNLGFACLLVVSLLNNANTQVLASGAKKAAANKQTAAGKDCAELKGLRKKLNIIEFYSDYCKPCRKFAPVWQSVSTRCKGLAEFKRVNVQTDKAMMEKYGQYIDGVPTLVWTDSKGKFIRTTGSFANDTYFIEAIRIIGSR